MIQPRLNPAVAHVAPVRRGHNLRRSRVDLARVDVDFFRGQAPIHTRGWKGTV